MAITPCRPRKTKRHRTTLSITIDPHVLQALKSKMKEWGETNLSSVIEGFIECGVRDTCEGCPWAESADQEKVGVGKIVDREGQK